MSTNPHTPQLPDTNDLNPDGSDIPPDSVANLIRIGRENFDRFLGEGNDQRATEFSSSLESHSSSDETRRNVLISSAASFKNPNLGTTILNLAKRDYSKAIFRAYAKLVQSAAKYAQDFPVASKETSANH